MKQWTIRRRLRKEIEQTGYSTHDPLSSPLMTWRRQWSLISHHLHKYINNVQKWQRRIIHISVSRELHATMTQYHLHKNDKTMMTQYLSIQNPDILSNFILSCLISALKVDDLSCVQWLNGEQFCLITGRLLVRTPHRTMHRNLLLFYANFWRLFYQKRRTKLACAENIVHKNCKNDELR